MTVPVLPGSRVAARLGAHLRPAGPLPPGDGGAAARVLFLSLDAMGWSTYARTLVAAADTRPDVHAVHLTFGLAGLLRGLTAPLPGDPAWGDANVRRVLVAEWALRRWAGAVGLDRFDVVHVTPQHYAAGLLAELRRVGTPLSVGFDATTAQAKWELEGRDAEAVRRRYRRLLDAERAAFDQAALLVPMSNWAAAGAAADAQDRRSRMVVVPPRLVASPEPTGARGARRSGLPRIGWVGTGWRRKGGDRLLAWHQERWAGRAELHLVGGDAEVPAGAAGVVAHGRMPNERLRAELLPSLDLFVLPTWKDMTPWAVLEAAAAGLPVVSSAIGGLPELVVDGRTGYLLPPGDDRGFVAAVDRLLGDERLRSRFGTAARAHAAGPAGDGGPGRLLDELGAIARRP